MTITDAEKSMNVPGFLFSKSQAQLRAEAALIEAEDRLMSYHEQEAHDLGFHAHCDADRCAVIVARQRSLAADQRRNSDRNLAATLLIGGVLMFKGIINFADVVAFAEKVMR